VRLDASCPALIYYTFSTSTEEFSMAISLGILALLVALTASARIRQLEKRVGLSASATISQLEKRIAKLEASES